MELFLNVDVSLTHLLTPSTNFGFLSSQNATLRLKQLLKAKLFKAQGFQMDMQTI